ncbi:MAG: hypothetical protein ACD_2C00156G0006 [uncultured bacterium (gcode 4)]|uniref:Uncharacterized protein n=1 Tax=uncultured bacterium (gcode 4) TaxID=1234023 RepID=K2FEB5_9BACT|nr:MAG: hypothetical protein ACD_2C00156G0006 [uncultured bacterium (gcode 4)]
MIIPKIRFCKHMRQVFDFELKKSIICISLKRNKRLILLLWKIQHSQNMHTQ